MDSVPRYRGTNGGIMVKADFKSAAFGAVSLRRSDSKSPILQIGEATFRIEIY